MLEQLILFFSRNDYLYLGNLVDIAYTVSLFVVYFRFKVGFTAIWQSVEVNDLDNFELCSIECKSRYILVNSDISVDEHNKKFIKAYGGDINIVEGIVPSDYQRDIRECLNVKIVDYFKTYKKVRVSSKNSKGNLVYQNLHLVKRKESRVRKYRVKELNLLNFKIKNDLDITNSVFYLEDKKVKFLDIKDVYGIAIYDRQKEKFIYTKVVLKKYKPRIYILGQLVKRIYGITLLYIFICLIISYLISQIQ